MKLQTVTLIGQQGQHEIIAITSGWNAAPAIKFGVWTYEGCVVLWNALSGAGELFLDRIELAFDSPVQGILPRANWSVNGNVLTIGAGQEYFPPRASMRVRWKYPQRYPDRIPYGTRAWKFPAALKRDIFSNLAAKLVEPRDTGMWAPLGDRQPDAPGGTGIAAIGGWEQDARGMILRHDLTMERMAVGDLESDGLPRFQPQNGYRTTRGWSKAGQLARFTRSASPYQEYREPLVTWPGSSPYRDLMLGVKRDNGYLPYDAQHLCRATTPAKAAAQCGDHVAQFDFDVIAADCSNADDDPVALPNGSRGLAWTIDALAHSSRGGYEADELAVRMAKAQAPSGALLRAPYGYNFSPSPWDNYGMPKDMDADAMLERAISCHALMLLGDIRPIRLAIEGQPHPMVKFVGAGKNQTEVFPTYQFPCGPGTWECWIAFGAAMALDPRSSWWHAPLLAQPTPGGKRGSTLTELRDILRAETVGIEQTIGVRMVLEEMLA